MEKKINKLLNIDHPVLMAPMFLVSNEDMIIAALENGITGAFPAANYRTKENLENAIKIIRKESEKPFGVNLIVNKSNKDLDNQLDVCLQQKVAFVITSLGNPAKVIERCHKMGILVFCDVTDDIYARKVVNLGADALIAVNSNAGGHPGKIPGEELLKKLTLNFDIPVIYAGGIAEKKDYQKVLKLGAAGVSVGTLFMATKESPVSEEYKQALIKYGANDIVLNEKLSGAPLNVINTPYIQKSGLKSSLLSRYLYKHKKLRKYLKSFVMKKGMKALERSAFGTSYKNVWVAGPSIEKINEIVSVKTRIEQLTV